MRRDFVCRSAAIKHMARTRILDARVLSIAIKLLIVFAATDLLFIGLHLAFQFQVTRDHVFSLDGDRVAGEFWQYVKEYWVLAGIAVLAWRRRQLIYVIWSTVFAYLLADDAMEIHGRIGPKIGKVLQLRAVGNLQQEDLGELVFTTTCAVALLCIMALLYRKADPDAKRVTFVLVVGLLLMGVFGVGCDAMHALTKLSALTVIEEGGELLVMSGICSLVMCEAWLEAWTLPLTRSGQTPTTLSAQYEPALSRRASAGG